MCCSARTCGVVAAVVVAACVPLGLSVYETMGFGKQVAFAPPGKCKNLNAPDGSMHGSEDLAIFDANTVLVSSGDLWRLFKSGIAGASPGGMYAVDLQSGSVTRLRVEGLPDGVGFQAHGIFFSNSTRRLYAVSHADTRGGTRVEVFDVVGSPPGLTLSHYATTAEGLGNMVLNDVVEGAEDGSDLYVTQFRPVQLPFGGERSDSATLIEKAAALLEIPQALLGFPRLTSVWRCTVPSSARGASKCTVVAGGFLGANGISITPDRRSIFVNDPIDRLITVFERGDGGALTRVSDFKLRHAVDNIEYDEATASIHAGSIPLIYRAMPVMEEGPAHAGPGCPGGLLRVSLLGTGGASFADGVQRDVLVHDGSLLSQISAAVQVGGKIVMGSPFNDGVLLCDA